MRYAGIDIAAEKHFAAVVDADGQVVVKATPIGEDQSGYERLRSLLGPADDLLVVMEATGHYWKNLFAVLKAEGYAIAVINPLRTSRFASEDLRRAKTDAIDCVALARFGAQKRPQALPLADSAANELRELVRFRDRLVQRFGDDIRQLHRLVDLGFPELTRHVKTLDSDLALSLLAKYPTAAAVAAERRAKLAKLAYGGRFTLGKPMAVELLAAAQASVGQHHGPVYQMQVRFLVDGLQALKARIAALSTEIERKLDDHDVGRHLTSIDGIGSQTAARLVAELANLGAAPTAKKIAAYAALVPAIRQSGKHQPRCAGLTNVGHVELRRALYMPTLTAVKKNPWLKPFYDRLVERGKPKKLALLASMRKLLVAVAWVIRHKAPFNPRLALSSAGAGAVPA